MVRVIDTATLDQAAIDYAGMFLLPSARTIGGSWATGPEKIVQDFYDCTFADEFEYLVAKTRQELGKHARDRLDNLAKMHFKPRDEAVFESLLREQLAINRDGDHIEGAIGSVEIGRRVVGRGAILRRTPIVRPAVPGQIGGEWLIGGYKERMVATRQEWPVYMGEGDERADGRIRDKMGAGPGADPLPETAEALPLGANVTNISAELCIAFLDQVDTRIEEGDAAPNIRGRTGSQPADPDASETGTLLFTLVCSTGAAVAAAVDDTDGTCSATFNSITDDSSADATGTLGYCRVAATGTGADDHIDGNATTDASGATDWNTLSIVSGSTVSMTSAVVGMSQGSTAS